MRKSTVRRMLQGIGVGGLIGAAILSSPAAHADVGSYIADLQNSPWNFTGPVGSFIAVGEGVCHREAYGWNQEQLVDWVVGVTGAGILEGQAQYIVEAAEIDLCPGVAGRTV